LTFLTSSRTNEKNITRKSQQEILEDEFDRTILSQLPFQMGLLKDFSKEKTYCFLKTTMSRK